MQRYCSYECRRAVERVRERERRWKERGAEREWEYGLRNRVGQRR